MMRLIAISFKMAVELPATKNALWCVALGLVLALSTSQAIAKETPSKPVFMPEEIADVRLATPLKDFVNVRKKAKRFAFFEDGEINLNKPEQMLIENLDKNGLFDNAFYHFENFLLTNVVVAGKRTETDAHCRNEFLGNVLRRYGQPDEIVVAQQDGLKKLYNSPGLI